MFGNVLREVDLGFCLFFQSKDGDFQFGLVAGRIVFSFDLFYKLDNWTDEFKAVCDVVVGLVKTCSKLRTLGVGLPKNMGFTEVEGSYGVGLNLQTFFWNGSSNTDLICGGCLRGLILLHY